MLILRIPGDDSGSLETDFSGIPHPRATVVAVVVVSCFATMIGQYSHLPVSYMGVAADASSTSIPWLMGLPIRADLEAARKRFAEQDKA